MKKWICLCLSMMLIMILAACGGKEANSAEERDGKELKEISIMLDWYPNAVHSFLYVAEEKGYFKEEGLNVDIQFPANPTDPLNLAAAGKVTLGLYYQPDIVMARANEDVPVKSVGAIVRSPLNRVIFPEDSPIQSPKDLEGKTVGYPGIPLNEVLLKTMISNDGGNYENVNVVDVGFELGASIVSGKTDAVIGAFINHEVPVLKHQGHDTLNFNPAEFGVPNYYELVAVTGDQTLEKDRKAIQAFWRAASKGYEFMAEHPDEALKILLDNQDEANFPLDKKVEKESLEILLPKMKSEEGFGSQNKESWEKTGKWLKESGLIKEIPAAEDLYINMGK